MSLKVLLAVMCVSAVGFTQTVTGNLEGRLIDPVNAVIPNAKISIKSVETGTIRTTETNIEGLFQVPFLALGQYEVRVEFEGFETQTVLAAVQLNRTTVVNFSLKLAGAQQAVTVTEVTPIVDTTSGQIRRSLDENLVQSVPLGGRDFRNLFRLIPGFQTNPTGGQNSFTLSSGSSASFNGTGTRSTTFQTDGVANDDNSENQNRQGVNISTVKEFQVLTNNFTAEFGRGAGAVVLVQTKSGTNHFHGEGYWLLTNSFLDARTYFQNAAGSRVDPATGKLVPNVRVPSSKTHRPGAVFGGPAVKNKLFFLGSYERFWAPGTTTSTISLLPREFRTVRVDPQLPDAAARRSWIQSVIDRYPNVDPNNTVTNPNGYTGLVSRTNQNQDLSGRVDFVKSERDIFYGRYQFGDVLIKNDELVRGTNVKQDHRFQNIGITWSRVFSARVTGEGRLGFGRRRMIVGLLDGDTVPIVTFTGVNTPSAIGNAGQFPLKRAQNDFQYVYNVSANLGSKHTLRFGADVRRYHLNETIQQNHRGFWTFAADGPYSALENFTRGVVQTYQQGFGPANNGYRTTEINLYAQDQYRATRNLTFDLGARFENVGKPSEVNNVVDLGYGTARYVEPRIGFAYSPSWQEGFLSKLTGGPGNSSIRGGYGIFHGRVFQSIFAQGGVTVRFNPPNGATLTFRDPDMSVANPLGSFRFVPGPPTSQVVLALVDPNLSMPYTQQWNLTLERQLKSNVGLSISYIGNRGIGFIQFDARNRARFPATSTVPASYAGANFPGVRFDQIDPNPFNANPAPGFISLQQQRINLRRPDGRYGSIFYTTNRVWTYYNALQVAVSKRMSHGLSTQAWYSWSKNIDTTSEATFVGTGDTNFLISDTQGPRGNRGPSRLDQPQRFVWTFAYELPFYRSQRGILGRMFGGWAVNGIATFGFGNPVTAVLGYDLNGDGTGGDRPFLLNPAIWGNSIDNARINPSSGRQFAQDQVPVGSFFPNAEVASQRSWPWYPGTGFVASAGRNILRVEGQNQWDLVFVKNTKILGKDRGHELQFRAEMFNAFNRVQFGLPNLTVVDTGVAGWRINPNFGQISGLNNSPRSMQMMLRYQF
ncbi:MAG: carboxypeptidase regulatory-like domain-containing protein [Bryobacteraceae bacterium]